MGWIRLDDDFVQHPKIASLTDRAFRAHIAAMAYANRYLTDGFVPTALLPDGEVVMELHRAGLWDAADGGITIHDYLEYQPSRDAVRQRQQQRRASSVAGGQARAALAQRDDDGHFAPSRVSSRPAGDTAGTPSRQRTSPQAQAQHPRPKTENLAPTRRDEMFEAVADVCGISTADLTRSARGALNRAVADLRAVGATADEVRRRAGNWPYAMPLTPPGLAKHYPALDGQRRATATSSALRIAQRLAAEGR